MADGRHEFRDPIHNFISVDDGEREVINSAPVQRLRNIHQLALTYLVYPATTHKRFEHALGVMHLASHVYDILTDAGRIDLPQVRDLLPNTHHQEYWRQVVRMAGLLHDVGHLPFSHAAEELLPDGKKHEDYSKEIILSAPIGPLLNKMKLNPSDVAKIAVGPGHSKEPFDEWEMILTKIITGDEFGVDRMDYLLRDSLHAGVAYGRFDHHRLIDTLKILPTPDEADDLTIGIESGGIHAAEGMWLARYFMREQLYFHRVRRAYDIHLKKFLQDWLPDGKFPDGLDEFLAIDDIHLLHALKEEGAKGNKNATAIISREHFKILYEFNPLDQEIHPEPDNVVHKAAAEKFGEENVFLDSYKERISESDFPVVDLSGNLIPARARSRVIKQIPHVTTKNVFISPDYLDEGEKWLKKNIKEVLEDA